MQEIQYTILIDCWISFCFLNLRIDLIETNNVTISDNMDGISPIRNVPLFKQLADMPETEQTKVFFEGAFYSECVKSNHPNIEQGQGVSSTKVTNPIQSEGRVRYT